MPQAFSILNRWDYLCIMDVVVLEQRLFADARSRVRGRRKLMSRTHQSIHLVLKIDDNRTIDDNQRQSMLKATGACTTKLNKVSFIVVTPPHTSPFS